MSSDHPKSPQSMDIEEAKQRLECFGQGVLTVSEYFNSCRSLVERVHGKVTYSNESRLLSYFLKGLNEKTKKILELARVNDVYTARKMAIVEEMFTDKEKLENKDDDSRIQKIEILHYLGWEKMRSYDTHFQKLNDEIREVRRENAELKFMIKGIADKLKVSGSPEDQNEEAPAQGVNEVKEVVLRLEKTTEQLVDNSISPRTFKSGIDRIGINFKPLRDQSTSIEKKVEISYEWIRKIHEDLECMNTPKKPRAPKRTLHTDVILGMEMGLKKPRMTSIESKVLQSLSKVVTAHELDGLKNGNVTVGVEALYNQYTTNIEDIEAWMQQNPKPCTKHCSLCGEFHFSYSCENVRLVKDRKRILIDKGGYCNMCWNKHQGTCRKLQECRICMRAEEEGRRVVGGYAHSRMMCPLQEEYWTFRDIADHLFDAKNVLEKE